MPNLLIRATLILALLTHAPPGVAAEIGSERFAISLGAFITDRDTETRVDSSTLGVGTTIVLEDDLGLDSSQTVFRVDGHYRIADRHRLNFSLFDLSRDATNRLNRDIQYGDETFRVDTTITSVFDLDIYKLAYSYAFQQTDQGFISADIGFHLADFSVSIDAPSAGQFQSRTLSQPLPVIGIRGAYYLGPRLAFAGNVEWFGLEFDDVGGRLLDIYAGLDYKVTDHLALGVAYNYVTVDFDVGRSNFSGALDWEYDGFLLYGKLSFGSVGTSGAR